MMRERAGAILAEAGLPAGRPPRTPRAEHALTTYYPGRAHPRRRPAAPDLLGDLLYAGGIHVMAGEPDGGKTTLCLWQALGLLRAGRTVLMLDEEGGAEMTAEKLIALGATEDDAARLHYCPVSGEDLDGCRHRRPGPHHVACPPRPRPG